MDSTHKSDFIHMHTMTASLRMFSPPTTTAAPRLRHPSAVAFIMTLLVCVAATTGAAAAADADVDDTSYPDSAEEEE